ncbi:MAG: phosphatidate cytidylyltransferase [Clostridia bacterium]|nr:phosphatidate cytidylyltransferase [Clostridia bacterium]
MKQRIITGLLLTALLAVLLWLPGWCMAIATLICIGCAVWEEYHALSQAGHKVVSWPTWTAMVLSVPLTHLLGQKVMIPLVGLALLAITVRIMFRKEPELTDLTMSALPLITVALPGLSLVTLSLIDPYLWWRMPIENKMPFHAVEVVMLSITFAVPLAGDVMALFIGKAFGKRKFCEAVSPKKTIAGSIGGLGGSMLAAIIIYLLSLWLCNEATRSYLPTWWMYLIIGLLGGFVGQMGDLFASLVKRHCKLKDYSNLFPGHGGMLDRLDSVLFMAVLMYCYLLFFSNGLTVMR